jgi:hypothetical protein
MTMKATDKNQTSDEAAINQTDWTWAEPKSLKVNPAFQALIPVQAKGELLALEQSIQAEGCLVPLRVWKGHNIILDGHTRRELCMRHKKRVKVQEVDLPDEKAAVAFILQVQRQRRNLTREAMSYFRGSEYNALKQERGGNKRGRRPKDQSDPMATTAKQLAEKYGVGEMTVKRDAVFAHVIDKIVDEYGDPEVKRKLLGADVRLTQGTARVLLRMPTKERKATVDQLIAKGELPRAKKGTAAERTPRQIAQGVMARLQKQGPKHARSVVQQLAKLLGMEVVEKETGK